MAGYWKVFVTMMVKLKCLFGDLSAFFLISEIKNGVIVVIDRLRMFMQNLKDLKHEIKKCPI